MTSDVVESPHGPTHVLARAVPRAAVGRSLDIGTGGGAHALHLAAHSDITLGVDVSPRAVAFAEFNAALNGVTNVEFTVADGTSGLDNEQPFDLIISNRRTWSHLRRRSSTVTGRRDRIMSALV